MSFPLCCFCIDTIWWPIIKRKDSTECCGNYQNVKVDNGKDFYLIHDIVLRYDNCSMIPSLRPVIMHNLPNFHKAHFVSVLSLAGRLATFVVAVTLTPAVEVVAIAAVAEVAIVVAGGEPEVVVKVVALLQMFVALERFVA